MPSPRISLIGERGAVSRVLQERLAHRVDFEVQVISTDAFLNSDVPLHDWDLVVLATTDFASAAVVEKLPLDVRVLDISPAFRLSSDWVYGLPELAGGRTRIAGARKVANPGCFATSAILLLEPLVRRGVLSPGTPLYLDGTGGYSTGGNAMIEKAEAGQLSHSAVYSLNREHRHVEEVRRFSGCTGPLWFSPKVGNYARGIRMQIPLCGVERTRALEVYRSAYSDGRIQVHEDVPSRIAADAWANRPGAGIWVIPQPGGVLVTCALDNLGKGAVDSALDNIDLMLSGHFEAVNTPEAFPA